MQQNSENQVRAWLYLCSIMVLIMTVIGGITRLSGSGLSITQWQPITGIIPPLNELDWQGVFAQYKLSPEFQKINFTMDISEFKSIFLVEFFHRIMARITGLIMIIPFAYFCYRRYFNSREILHFLLILMLMALQGFIGWYMVKSGLINNPHVSPYRLALHLSLALILYGLLLQKAFSWKKPTNSCINLPSLCCAIIVFIQIISGAFVAGNNAGLVYNSFPLMDEKLIPDGLWSLTPSYINLFENITTVQFSHRFLALLSFLAICNLYVRLSYATLSQNIKKALHIVIIMLMIQVTLGIATLVCHVPLILASLHQLGALLLFGSLLNLICLLKAIR